MGWVKEVDLCEWGFVMAIEVGRHSSVDVRHATMKQQVARHWRIAHLPVSVEEGRGKEEVVEEEEEEEEENKAKQR
jgi:hypothetical protein